MAGQLKIVSCLLWPSVRRLHNCNRKPSVLRHLEAINPFPEVNWILCFLFSLDFASLQNTVYFTSTRTDIGDFEVQACSPMVLLTMAATEPHFGRFNASGCRIGCTEWPRVQAVMWLWSRSCLPPTAWVFLAPWRKRLSQGIKTGTIQLLWHKENLLR